MKIYALIGLTVLSISSFAQTGSIADETGYKPYATFQIDDFDSINLANLKLDIHLPLLQIPQRGNKLNVSYELAFESNSYSYDVVPCDHQIIYDVNGNPEEGPCIDEAHFEFWRHGGGIYVRPSFGMSFDATYYPSLGLKTRYADHSLYYVDTQHAYTADGSGYQVKLSNNCLTNSAADALITDKQGIQTAMSCGGPVNGSYIRDANGNQLTYNYSSDNIPTTITDTLGNVLPVGAGGETTADYSGCTGQYPINQAVIWTVPGVEGRNISYKFCYANTPQGNYSVNCDANTFDVGPFQGCPGFLTVPLGGGALQSLVLPNGTAYTFEYDVASSQQGQSTYYDLTKITLPTGGTISYVWTDFTAASGYTGYIPGFSFARAISSRTVDANDGTGPHKWTYQQGVQPPIAPYVQSDLVSATATYSILVTDPENNDTVHTFTDPFSGYESSVQYYQGPMSPTSLIKEVRTDYSGDIPSSGCCAIYINAHPIRVSTVWANGETSVVETDYDSAIPFAQDSLGDPEPGHISLGLVTGKRVYDYGNNAKGSPLFYQKIKYRWESNNDYLSSGLVSLPEKICIAAGPISDCVDPAGMSSYTQYAYDGAGSPSGVHGNQTSVSSWINNSSTYQTSTAQYSTYGMPISRTTNGVTETFVYDSSSLYPSEKDYPTVNGVEHKEWFSYDHATGAILSHTDANGSSLGDPSHTQTYHYDSLGRLLSISYPDSGVLSLLYSDGANSRVTQTRSASPDPNIVTTTVADGLGRIQDVQTSNSSTASCAGGVVHSITTYSPSGRKGSVSNPFCSTSENSYGLTQYQYDALGRVKEKDQPDGSNIKFDYTGGSTVTETDEVGHQWRRVSDALGRLVKVFEPGANNAPVLETDYQYNALNALVNVTQSGLSGETPRSRSFTYDSLSRLLSSTNPETGTIAYSYDANGNLQTKTDARGVVTTYSYDTLNRLLSKTYSGGIAAATRTSCYQYDTATNGIGRLSAEWTQVGVCPASPPNNAETRHTIISYDAMGRVLGEQQCHLLRCSMGTPITSSVHYDLAGSLTSYSNGLGSLSLSQSYDSAGRLQTVRSSLYGAQYPGYPANLFSVGAYTPAGAIQNLNLGPNLNVNRTYDNRVRITGQTVVHP